MSLRTLCLSVRSDEEIVANIRSYCPVSGMGMGPRVEWNFQRLSSGTWQPPLVGSFFADSGLCGVSGNRGLLRFHDDGSGPVSQQFVDSAFGSRGVRADVFAFDWRARQFALSDSFGADGSYTTEGGTPMIVTLDPFDMVIEPWGLTIDKFEHALLVPLVEDSLLPTLFAQWLVDNGIDSLALEDCAGATVRGCQMVCVSPVLISERKIYEHGVRRQEAAGRRAAAA